MSETPWRATQSGCPVFISESYEEHVQEWINKEQEGKKVLWALGAIATSLVGRCLGRNGDHAVSDFALAVGARKSRVYQLASAHSLRVELEYECSTRVEHLPEALTLQHFRVVAEGVRNPGGTNLLDCMEWLEEAYKSSRSFALWTALRL